MNRLSKEKRVQIITLLVEGNSLRATSRIADVSINTVTNLFVNVGKACEQFHNKHVVNIKATRVQCDEIWSFVYAKEKNASDEKKALGLAGNVWTWVAIDADTKLVISWYIGTRDTISAYHFMYDLAARLKNKVQLTTDGLAAYEDAIEAAFKFNVDYGRLTKIYGPSERYIGSTKDVILGAPDKKYISTSYIERQNLSMRMHMRRFTRKTNAFSKKIENHGYAIALYFVYYNFVRIHKTLRVTPAMEAGLTKKLMNIEDIINLAYYSN